MPITTEAQELHELREAYRLRLAAERVIEAAAYPVGDDDEARIYRGQLRARSSGRFAARAAAVRAQVHERELMTNNILYLLADVVGVLKSGTDDPDDTKQITKDDKEFFAASKLFVAELRREAEERGQGEWSTVSLLPPSSRDWLAIMISMTT
jgi:hypothetical protein